MAETPTLSINFADPDVLQDPYPVFDAIREAGPAVYNPLTGAWMVASYDHVKEVMMDDARFVPEAEKWEALYGGAVVESLEEPRHGELRSVIAPMFRASYLREIRPVITDLIIGRLECLSARLKAGETVDIVPEVARAVAGRVLAHILGVAEADVPHFLGWARDMGATLESYDEPDEERSAALFTKGTEATKLTCRYAGQQIDERRTSAGGDDLIAKFAHSPITETMSRRDQEATIAQVIVAGHDNITHTLAHVFIVLAQFPEQRAMIEADRSLIPQAIEEILRWRTSAMGDTRLVKGKAEIGGVELKDGDRVMVFLAGANRDPSRWDDPNSFDITREQVPHITFGAGVHTCIGNGLARAEAQVLMEELLDRVPKFRLADERIDYGPPLFMRGPEQVRITL